MYLGMLLIIVFRANAKYPVNVAGVTVHDQYFSPATLVLIHPSPDFDGILGLAYPALSNLRQVSQTPYLLPMPLTICLESVL